MVSVYHHTMPFNLKEWSIFSSLYYIHTRMCINKAVLCYIEHMHDGVPLNISVLPGPVGKGAPLMIS